MIAALFVLALGVASAVMELQGPRGGGQPAGADAVLILPLRVHILTARDLELADCKLRDSDVTRIVGKLNEIWSKAGVYFGLEAIVREPAAQTHRFRELGGEERMRSGSSLIRSPLKSTERDRAG